MIAAVDAVLATTDAETKIIPGHGPLSNRDELVDYRQMLSTVVGRVQAAIAAGKSVEDVLAMKPTAEFDEQWGGGFLRADRFIQVIYAGLAD